MRVTVALIADTIGEAMARRVFWGLFALSTAMIAFFLFLLRIDVVDGAVATISLFGLDAERNLDVMQLVRRAQSGVATFLYTWGMLLAVFAASGLVPSVLERGRVELLLSKPIRRWQILVCRYVGTVLVVGANIAYLVFGIWTILGYKTGIWAKPFLLTIVFTLFIFMVLLGVVTLVGVLFENAALSTMAAGALMISSPILAQTRTMRKLLNAEWARVLWDMLYWTLPKVYDVGRMTLDYVFDRSVDSYAPLVSSAVFGMVTFGVAVIAFSKKDY